MELEKAVKAAKELWRPVTAIVAVGGFVGTVLSNVDKVQSGLGHVLQTGLVLEKAPLVFHGFKPWFLGGIVSTLLITLVLGAFLVQARRQVRGELTQTRQILNGQMNATEAIRSHHFNVIATEARHYQTWHRTYYISKNYDTQVEGEITYSAANNHQLGSLLLELIAEPPAPAVPYLNDLDFGVEEIGGKDGDRIVYLQTVNEPHRKRVVLFPLPVLEGATVRRYKYSYRWPGLFRKLKTAETEQISFNFASAFPLLEVEVGVFAETKRGGAIFVQMKGQHPPDAALKPVEDPDAAHSGWRGFKYHATNVPVGASIVLAVSTGG